MSLHDADDLLWKAINILATSPKSLQYRVEEAVDSHIFHILKDDLPEHLRDDFEALFEQIMKIKTKENENKFKSAKQVFSEKEALEIANKILIFYYETSLELYKKP
ncbi:hypothetical protein BH20ACI4_BH20ACI4_00930 [soil metagenome]